MSPRWMPSAVQAPAGACRGSRRQFDGSILRKLLWLTLASMCSRRPSRPASNRLAHLLHGRLVAAFMADAEHAAGFGAGGQDPFGAGGVEGQGLFAEHLFAGGKAGDRHFLVQQMRRHYCDRIDIGALEQVPVVGDDVEAMRCSKGRDRVVIDVASGHYLEAWTLGQTRDDLLAPPAEPDNADPDHVASFLCFASPNNVGSRANVQWFAATPLPRPITAPMSAHTRGALISVKNAL